MELRYRHVRAWISIKRNQFVERPVADHDTCGMGAGVAIETFQLQGDIEQPGDLFIAIAGVLKLRLTGDGVLQVDGIGGIGRHEFGEPIDLAIGHLQHSADIAYRRTRLQGPEGDDLGYLVMAIALLDIADHLITPVLAEVDIKVRHRYAFGISKISRTAGQTLSGRGR